MNQNYPKRRTGHFALALDNTKAWNWTGKCELKNVFYITEFEEQFIAYVSRNSNNV